MHIKSSRLQNYILGYQGKDCSESVIISKIMISTTFGGFLDFDFSSR